MQLSDGDMNKHFDSLMNETALLGGNVVLSENIASVQSVQPQYRARFASLESFALAPSDYPIDLESNLSEQDYIGSNLS